MSRTGQAVVLAEENGTLVYNEETKKYEPVKETH